MNADIRSFIKAIGTLRATLLFVALIARVLLYIFNPPYFISKKVLLLPFPFLATLDFVSAVVTGIIFVECVRIIAKRSTSWTPRIHFIVVSGVVVLLAGSRVLMASQTSGHYYSHGWSLAEKGDHQQALLSLGIAVKYDPNNMKAYLERAYLHRRLGDFTAGLNDCNKAINLAPKNADAYACRGYTYYYLCDQQKALDEWNKAISLNADLAGTLDKWIKAVKNPSYKC